VSSLEENEKHIHLLTQKFGILQQQQQKSLDELQELAK
jgi:hypothetical protein